MDIDAEVQNSSVSYFENDTCVSNGIRSIADSVNLQDSLDIICNLTAVNNMNFSDTKFELLRYGENNSLKEMKCLGPTGAEMKKIAKCEI